MKAVLLTAHGGPEKLVYGDAPDPVAGPGEIVVDVHAASVNAADYKVRLGGGAYNAASKLQFPYILGRDFSGIVSALGAGVDDLKIGDAVFGVMDAGIEGCYAEKVKIKAALVAKKRATLALDQPDRDLGLGRHRGLEARRDGLDPGRRRRGRRFCDPAR